VQLYNIFKICSLVIAIIGLVIELPILVWSTQEALKSQNLVGSARAQSEMFMIPMMLFGGPCAIVGTVLIIINAAYDLINKLRHKMNIILYIILTLIVLIPPISWMTLIPLMYSGWK